MPSRKQRRRQAKERRHEYEVVYLDEDGNEVESDEEDDERDVRPARPKAARAAAAPGKKPGTRAPRQTGARPGRKIDPPSWQRVFRRAAIFAPVMLLVIYFLKPKNASAASLLVQLVVLLFLFLPFSYYMDTFMYRSYRKRIGDPIPPRERKPRG